MESQVIAPQYILSGTLANRPNGNFDGQIYYATDNQISYYWDGENWKSFSFDLIYLNSLVAKNSFNVLQLEAKNSLIGSQDTYMYLDTYSDSNGFLNTINTTNTTSIYNALTDSYQNYENGGTINNNSDTSQTSMTINCTAKKDGIISSIYVGMNTTSMTYTLEIIQNSETLMSKEITPTSAQQTIHLSFDDYSSLISSTTASGAFSIVLTRTSGTAVFAIYNTNKSYDGTYFSYTNQKLFGYQYTGSILLKYSIIGQIEIKAEALDYEPTNVQVYFKSSSNLDTFSVSFDGVNFSEYEIGSQYTIENKGQILSGIIKQNKAESSIYGHAIMFW